MMWRDAVTGETDHVLARGVTRVVVPDVVRITLSEPRHQQVACHFRQDRCASDAEAAAVATHNGGVWNRQRSHRATIDNDVIRFHTQAS